MSLVIVYRDNAGDLVEMTDRVRRGSIEVVQHAEEGSVGSCSLEVLDPDSDFFVNGHRKVYLQETDAIADPQKGVFYVGYTANRPSQRDVHRTEFGRTITLNLVDLNTVFDRRIMRGSDANRPAETDVERAQWLEATNEMSLVDADTYLSTANPVDMDAADLRNQTVRQIWQDMADHAQKNYFLINEDLGLTDPTSGYTLWYGKDDPETVTALTASISISNDLADIDEVDVFAPSIETTVEPDPSRVYSGVVVEYDGGTVYVTDPDTAAEFALAGRDTTLQAPNVKTAAKAAARGERFLAAISTEEWIVKTAIIVPAAKVNAVKAGYRIQFKLTHEPGFEDYTWGRVLNCTIRDNVGLGFYELALEISATPTPPPTPPPPGTTYPACGSTFWPYQGTLAPLTDSLSTTPENQGPDWDCFVDGVTYHYEITLLGDGGTYAWSFGLAEDGIAGAGFRQVWLVGPTGTPGNDPGTITGTFVPPQDGIPSTAPVRFWVTVAHGPHGQFPQFASYKFWPDGSPT